MKFYENEGIRVQEVRACPLCGRKGVLLYQDLRDRLFDAPGKWTLLRCPHCGLVWLNPRPLSEEVWKIYKEYHTHSVVNTMPARFASLRKAIEGGILAAALDYEDAVGGWRGKLMGRILSRFGLLRDIVEGRVMWLKAPWRGQLLDIGCGSGSFLARMRELGWKVVGVEPDSEAARVAREHFKLEVFQGTLEEANFPDDYFDVITMSHVIEHVPDPIGFLTECRRVLKPGGRLIITTPNVRSLGQRLFGYNWRGWEPPRHMFLFSSQTLRRCAERTGLTVKMLRTTARSARGIWAASRTLQKEGKLPGGSPGELNWQLRLERLAFWFLEYSLCYLRDVGEELVMIASKKDEG